MDTFIIELVRFTDVGAEVSDIAVSLISAFNNLALTFAWRRLCWATNETVLLCLVWQRPLDFVFM